MNRDEWYKQRNKRTDTYVSSNDTYQSAIHVIITDANDLNDQLISYFTLSILPRWCQKIIISADAANCHLDKKEESLQSFLTRKIKAIDPFCELSFRHDPNCKVTLELFIGEVKDSTTDHICISSSGWLAGCGFNQPLQMPASQTNQSFIGAAFAACLGAAEAFRFLNGQQSTSYSQWYSLWSNVVGVDPSLLMDGPPLKDLDLGKVHIVGCGAIGSSFTFLFPFSECSAKFQVIDPDHVESWNTTSSLLFDFDDAVNKRKKAVICANYLMSVGYETGEPCLEDYKRFPYEYNAEDPRSPDVIMCFANEHNIWATIQNNFPPLAFHATTSRSWGLSVGRHIPLVDECMVCTFKDLMKTEFKPVCSEVEVKDKSSDQTRTDILPFLSPAAAIIAFCELVKSVLGHSSAATTNFNMESASGIFIKDTTAFGGCYACGPQVKLYSQFGPYARHWTLSNQHVIK
jgi:hypothetical protein